MKIEGKSLRYDIDDALRVVITGGEMHVISRNSSKSVPFKTIFTIDKDFDLTVNSSIGSLSIDGQAVDGVKAVRVNADGARIVLISGSEIDFPVASRSRCTITA